MFKESKQGFKRSVAKGLLAGLIGGLVGSAVKTVGEIIYNPRTQGQTSPPVLLAERVLGRPLNKQQQTQAEQTIHYVFGGATGAIYGAAAEFAPIVTFGYGAAFGIVLQLFTHETLVPAAGLDVPAPQQPLREHLSELFTHILYGVSTEIVRRVVRKRLA
jgi:putative membrane protein